MKKLAFALMLALPFFFVACGDDDKDEEPEVKFTLVMPVQNWGADQAAVKNQVSSQFSLNPANSNADRLVYQTLNPIDANKYNLPWQFYFFENGALDSSAYYVGYQYEKLFEEWLGKNYTDYGWDETDECVYYGNTKKEEDATLLVVYAPYEEDGVEALSAIWIPLDDDTRADIHAVVKTKRAKANATAKSMI